MDLLQFVIGWFEQVLYCDHKWILYTIATSLIIIIIIIINDCLLLSAKRTTLDLLGHFNEYPSIHKILMECFWRPQ